MKEVIARVKNAAGVAAIRVKKYATVAEASIDVIAVAILIGVVAFIIFA